MKRHIHIYFAPRKTRDQVPGSVPGQHPPAEVSKLVQVLLQAIQDRQQGLTTDARRTTDAGEWDESKHPRAEGGRFSSSQHAAAAKNHEDAANNHEASSKAALGLAQAAHMQAAEAHRAAAELHSKAHSHLAANTGLGEEFASQAHAKTAAAKQASSHPAVQAPPTVGKAYGKLKQIASDPKQPMVKRAAAVKQLNELEKNAEVLASSPHAQAAVHPEMQAAANAAARQPDAPARHPNSMMPAPATGPDPKRMAKPGIQPVASRADLEHQLRATGEAPLSAGPGGPAGDKPTQATAKGSKAAVHQLLSTGHPFHVEELMKATGVTNKATIMTALSDLKNPKYAGQLGALTIEKRADGMYHVTKAPSGGFKAVGGGAAAPSGAPGAPAGAAPAQRIAAEPSAMDPHAVTTGSHPLSPYVPGDHVQANVGTNKQPWKVLGHNAEGHVVLQKQDGTKHRVEPGLLGKMTSKVAAPKGKPEPDQEAAMAAAEAYEGPMDDKSLETAGAEAGEDARKQKEHNALLDAKGLGKPTWAPGAPGAPGQKSTFTAPKKPALTSRSGSTFAGGKEATQIRENLKASGGASAKPSSIPNEREDTRSIAKQFEAMNKADAVPRRKIATSLTSQQKAGLAAERADTKNIASQFAAMNKPVPAAAARLAARGPLTQANRNLEASNLREARKIVKRPDLKGVEQMQAEADGAPVRPAPKSIQKMQAEADVAAAQQRNAARRTGPGGGGPLPMAKDPQGFDRNPVQNVQARMDAKKAPAKKSVSVAPRTIGNVPADHPALRKKDGSLDPRAAHLAEEAAVRAAKTTMAKNLGSPALAKFQRRVAAQNAGPVPASQTAKGRYEAKALAEPGPHQRGNYDFAEHKSPFEGAEAGENTEVMKHLGDARRRAVALAAQGNHVRTGRQQGSFFIYHKPKGK